MGLIHHYLIYLSSFGVLFTSDGKIKRELPEQLVWCSVNRTAGAALDRHGEERSDLEGKAVYLPVNLCGSRHLESGIPF